MRYNYTRQRQGRDFPDANEAKAERDKKSLLEHLEKCKEESERAATPVDGREPTPERDR